MGARKWREDAPATVRASMSAKRRKRLLDLGGNVCCECAVTSPLHLDHRIPLALGGADADENIQILCEAHHRAKTRQDARDIAKARRLAKKGVGTPPRPGTIKSRGFDKSRSRGMNGAIKNRRPKEADMAKATEIAKPTKKGPLPKLAKGNAGDYEFQIGRTKLKPGEHMLKAKGPKGTGRMR